MPEIAYVNGSFIPVAEARVSIDDRGFQFADSVYEVVVAPGGKPFRLEQHLLRLIASGDGISLPIDIEGLGIRSLIEEGIRRAGFADTVVYIQITRGVAPRDHIYSADLAPTVVATFKAKPVYDARLYRQGLSLTVLDDIRWANPCIKSTALLANSMLKNAARKKGYADAILISPDRLVRETTCANVFIVARGTLRTPPATRHILRGITRDAVLECAEAEGIPTDETDFNVQALLDSDEVFITSTTQDVMPVTQVDGTIIGGGKPGPVTLRLLERLRAMASAEVME